MKQAAHSMLFFILFILAATVHGNDSIKFAELGDLRLESGKVLKDCRIGYRTFGSPNSENSNAVLFPTWFVGTTQDLIDTGMIGPGKLIDTTRFYVIAVECLGNGVSSSPSNSKEQPGRKFPEFSIRDMVYVEYLLLTRELRLNGINAVAGISMGGMHAFEWMVSYPEFMKKVVSIVGTPRLASSDLLLLQAEIMALETGAGCGDAGQAMKTVSAIHSLALHTPAYMVSHTSPEEFPGYLAGIQKAYERFDATDWEWQLKAIIAHDIYRAYGGSPEQAAAAVRAKPLVIVSRQDHILNPEPSRSFAPLIGAKMMELDSDCGHAAFLCEKEKLTGPVNDYLAQ